MTSPILDRRSREVLVAVIAEYVRTAEPVGSRAVARRHIRGLSPATIRNVMDPDAIAAARLNADKNGCADRITLLLQAADEPVPCEPSFCLIVANLLTHTHLALAERYERLVAAGGSLILGGILADEHHVVVDALRARSFDLKTCRIVEGWASLLLALRARS